MSKTATRRVPTSRPRAEAGPTRRRAAGPDRPPRGTVREDRTARARRAPSPGGASALRERVSNLDAAGLLARFRVPIIVAVALLVVVAALYGPSCDLYRQWRLESARSQTLSELTQANEEVQGDIDNLTTEEGIKDEARRRGYVEEGEKSVVVDGLTEGDDSSDEPAEQAPAEPWYLGVTDFIFGYEGD